MTNPSQMSRSEVLLAELRGLETEHRDLDEAIRAMQDSGRGDRFTLMRLKKQKLALKDRIARLEDLITPDIIA